MKRLSRTRLFLLEMLVNLLVFCVGAAICLMALTRAYSLSAGSRVLTEAQRVCENAAIAFRQADGDLAQLPQLLSGRVEGDTLTVWYSQDWQPVRASRGIYRLVLRAAAGDHAVLRAEIEVLPPEGEPVTTLTVHHYTGGDAKGDGG